MKKIKTSIFSTASLLIALPFIASCKTGGGATSKTSVTIPTAIETEYTYTGNKITLNLSNYDDTKMTISGNTGTKIGNYTALVKLNDTTKYQWSDKTTDAKTYTWSIVDQSSIAVPTKINKTIRYTGSKITMLPDNYSDISDYCSITGNTGTDVGKYTATIKLNDKTKYKWSDNTTADKTIDWNISSETIRLWIPTEDTTDYYYTGKNITYTPNNFDSTVENISNNVQIAAETYTVIVSLKDKANYTWTDGSTDDISLTFNLNKGLIKKPTLNKTDNGIFTYTGSPLTYIPTNYSEYTQYISISGNSGTNVGKYTMTLSLKDKTNTQWADKTSADFTLDWKITPKQYALPIGKEYSHTGNLITFYPANFDESAMTIKDNIATDSGTYTATISLKDTANTQWTDGTTAPVTVTWKILSESQYYTVSKPTDTSIIFTHKSTGKVLSFTEIPKNTKYQINDDTGSITLTYAESTNADEILFSLTGEIDGSVNIIETSAEAEPSDVVVNLNGVTISDSTSCPLCLMCDGDVELSAKKESENTINDNRTTASDTETYNAAIYSSSDLKLKGKGTLNVTSIAYDGIHTKDDLKIQNLTLNVNSADNALKGNDSVTIDSGTITAISTYSNGIKTSNNSKRSSSEEIKGTVSINGGTVNIYSALDGIDSVYDAIVTETDQTIPTVLNITTCTYSSYSKRTYTKASNSSSYSGFNPGGGGGWPGPGGDQGNTNKYEESTKGIKADNTISILAGTVTIKAYDDAIHANNTNVVEGTGKVGTGNVVISGGKLSIYTMDDGIHADNTLTISDGIVNITNSYEGLEGAKVTISGGTNSVISTDDGINGTGTSGESIQITGGTNYIYAGGDGVDSNSNTSYDGILFSGGKTVIIQTSRDNSSIDTNQGYKYTGGYVLALGLSTGMSNGESTKCSNFSSIGTANTLSGTTITADGYVTVKMPKSMSVYAIFLGSNTTTISTSATYTSYDSNGVCWNA